MFRWFALAVFVTTIAVSTVWRRRARRLGGTIPRSAESTGLIIGRLFVALPLFGSTFAYMANPSWMAWASLDVPEWVRWTGVGLGLLVVPSIWWVLTTIGSNVSETVLTKSGHQLVTTGPYGWVRHPLYAVGLVLFISVGLMAANGFILLWTALAALAVRFGVIPQEEANLIAAFGDDYRDYRARTGALLPRLVQAG